MNITQFIKKRFRENWSKLKQECAAEKSCHSIAMSLSIGIFFGMMPVLGIRALLAFFTAWVFRVNRLIAAICAAAHELLIPFLPFLLYWQHGIGRFLFGQQAHSHDFLGQKPTGNMGFLKSLTQEGGALLTGAVIFSLVVAVLAYFIIRLVLIKVRSNQRP